MQSMVHDLDHLFLMIAFVLSLTLLQYLCCGVPDIHHFFIIDLPSFLHTRVISIHVVVVCHTNQFINTLKQLYANIIFLYHRW